LFFKDNFHFFLNFEIIVTSELNFY